MSKRSSLKFQVDQALKAQARFGQSKHEAKQDGTAASGIYSLKTMDTYREQCMRFADWAKQEHGCRYLEEAKPHVAEYLERERDRGLSASSLKLERSALSKMYQDSTVGASVSLPERSREDFIRSRGEKASDAHFSPEKNADLVDFCRGLGPRRFELEKMLGQDVVRDQEGNVWAHVLGKGGRLRWALATDEMKDRVWEIASRTEPDQLIFEHVHTTADIHSYRHEYAQELYRELTGEDYQLYHPNHDALLEVSENLGHSREDVVVNNYLR